MSNPEKAFPLGQLPKNQTDDMIHVNSLWDQYTERFEQEGQIADLDHVIQYGKQVVSSHLIQNINSLDTEIYTEIYLERLVNALCDRFEITFQRDDVDMAINYQRILASSSRNDHPQYARSLERLGQAFLLRYQAMEYITDLEQAIECVHNAVTIIPKEHKNHADFLVTLSTMLRVKFKRTGEVANINNAIISAQEALDATPEDDPVRRHTRLQNLGRIYKTIYDTAWQMSDLQKAIEYTQEAIDVASEDYSVPPTTLNLIGKLWVDKFHRTSRRADLEEAIKYGKRAVDATPENDAQRLEFLLSLGNWLRYLCEWFSTDDFQNSTKAYQDALACPYGITLYRIFAGLAAANNLTLEGKWRDAAITLNKALKLLPEVTPPSKSRDDLQYTLRQLADFSTLIGSVFVKERDLFSALQAIEGSRGIIAGLFMDMKSDISGLQESFPDLFSRYTRCRQEITEITQKGSSYVRSELKFTTLELQTSYEKLKEMQNEIRGIPRFERFLLPPLEKEIIELARGGPLVSFNISNISSEAFLVTSEGIQVLSLPDLSLDDVKFCLEAAASSGNFRRRDAEYCDDDDENGQQLPSRQSSDLQAELIRLWETGVKLVLQQLGLLRLESSSRQLPRIWWVSGGIMALVPLHAAGDHQPGSTENTLSHVISSYAPSFKALQFIQSRPPTSVKSLLQDILVVSMPITPGGKYSSLDVAQEVEAFTSFTEEWSAITVLERPMKIDVLTALRNCTLAHFACHGTADRIDPSRSSLLVGHESVERLTVSDLDQIECQRAQLIYLSACSTAETKVHNLVNEGIHMASSFQLAGFPHVIATIWGAHDDAAAEVAKRFYKGLLEHVDDSSTSVAQILQESICSFRNLEGNWKFISKWAPFIHLGC